MSTSLALSRASHIEERLIAVEPYLLREEAFLANYGDGLSDLPLSHMLAAFQDGTSIASLMLPFLKSCPDGLMLFADFESLKKAVSLDLIFCSRRRDTHEDHHLNRRANLEHFPRSFHH